MTAAIVSLVATFAFAVIIVAGVFSVPATVTCSNLYAQAEHGSPLAADAFERFCPQP